MHRRVTHRPVASTALRNAHGVWLFNVAEDTQRYLQAQSQLGHRKIERIFITQRHPDNLLGLPGMHVLFSFVVMLLLLPTCCSAQCI